MAYIGPEPNPGQNREVDDISSGFNGSTTAFTLQVNSQNVSPGSSNNIIVSLGGVAQNPGTDYNIAASTITFTTAPASGLSFFGLVLGQQVDIQSVADSASIVSPTLSGPTVTGDLSIADKIVHTGDTNTAIRFPAADTVSVETAGSERLRVDSSGAVGIGTASPEDSLHLKSGKLRIENAIVSNNDSTISYDNADFIVDVDPNNVRGSSSFQVKIDTVVGLTVDDNRRLGIGTTSPSNKLHVEDSASGVIIAKQTTNNGGFNTFEGKASGGTTTFYASHNGRVGAADGIIFGSDTAAANILDDYEEGTWTPALNSGTSLSYSEGRYVKIGAMVYAFWEITLPSTSSTSHMIINNTPFTSINHNASCGGTARDYQQYDIQDGPIYHVPKANTQIQVYKNSGQNFVESDGSGKNFRGCSIYQTET